MLDKSALNFLTSLHYLSGYSGLVPMCANLHVDLSLNCTDALTVLDVSDALNDLVHFQLEIGLLGHGDVPSKEKHFACACRLVAAFGEDVVQKGSHEELLCSWTLYHFSVLISVISIITVVATQDGFPLIMKLTEPVNYRL